MAAFAPSPAAPAVRCSGLVKRYRDVVAVDGLNLEVWPGECFGLLGPNGAGKTTTVEVLEGLIPADAGEVEILGRRWGRGRAADRAIRERLGIQLQETRLPDKLTVRETLRIFRSFHRQGRGVGETIATVELEGKADARIDRLSGGQRQRLALACALVGDPEILFLDEPTTGLDPQARLKLWERVERFKAGGGTVLLTTHYMEEAARLCDRVAILDLGRRIALGTPQELIASLGADQILEFEAAGGAVAEEPLRRLPGVRSLARRDGTYVLTVARVVETLPPLLQELQRQGVEVETLATHAATLEDVFVELTGKGLRDA
ncbi:MAG TPA: ABC transporter ATP-binding protein [Thermoanaerobaculia bacterium]|nr:ABC transporter ATP-binding protein [Thermoanaerobaculia bacterium]